MPLPNLKSVLPKNIIIFFLVGLAVLPLFISFPSLVYANHNNKLNIETNESQPTKSQNQEPTILPAPTESDIQPIPTPEGNTRIQQAAFNWSNLNPANWPGTITDFFVENIVNAVKTAIAVIMDFIFQMITGLPFGDIAALNEKIYAYQNGASNPSQIPHLGALDYTGFVTEEALNLNIPIDSVQYFASINPFAQVNAATGAQDLAGSSVLLDVWQRVRNVSYALAAVVIVIIGFMIMLRWRLDPRTVVTIQSALPRIIIALILITFSFAISGLLIDITRLVTEVVMSLVSVPTGTVWGFAGFAILLIGGLLVFAYPFGVAALLIGLVLAIIVLVVFLILIYKLLKRYVTFLLLTIFAPLFFLAGALPGAEGLILNWFRRQAAALMAIPMTALFVNLSFRIGFSQFTFSSPDNFSGGFPSPWPVVGGLSSVLGVTLLPPLVGLGIFFFATKVPDIVDEMFGIKEMGVRKGTGPGAIIGAPMGALGTLGTVGRAAPMIAGATASTARQGGFRGKLAGALYSASQPFARREYPHSLKDLRTAQRKTEPTPQEKFQTWNEQQEATTRASHKGVSAGPEGSTNKGDTGWHPGRNKE